MNDINIDGKNYLQLNADHNGIIDCPFCNKEHKHSKGDGHRWPHCDSLLVRSPISFNGKSFYKSDGYYVKFPNAL